MINIAAREMTPIQNCALQIVEAAEQQNKFKVLGWSEIIELPDPKWLIKDFLGEREFACLFGQPGVGKTFITLSLALAATRGEKFAGQFEIERQLDVLFAAHEGSNGMKKRIQALVKHAGVSTLERFGWIRKVPNLFEADDTAMFIDEIRERPVDILVIDTFATAIAGADENSSKDMGIVAQNVKRIIDALDCSVLAIHHAGKAGGYRGSSVIHGAVDAMYEVTKDKLKSLKIKEAEDFAPIPYWIVSVDLGFESKSAAIEWTRESSMNMDVVNQIIDAFRNLGCQVSQTAVAQEMDINRTGSRFQSAWKYLVNRSAIIEDENGFSYQDNGQNGQPGLS